MMYRLIFLAGPLKGRRLAIKQGTVVLGRDPSCSVCIPDDEISRQHASIEQKPEGIFLRDIGSMNGVSVNGAIVREATLKHDDVIELGLTKVQFQEFLRPQEKTARHVDLVDMLTLGAVAAVVVFEVLFLGYLLTWKRNVLPESASAAATDTVAQVEGATLAQAGQKPEQTQPRNNVTPKPADTTPARSDRDLQQLRADVQDIREQVNELAQTRITPPAVTAVPPARVELPSTQRSAGPPPDALVGKARTMLNEALAEESRHNLVQADQMLERIQIMAPDFLPSYIERARLFEKRGFIEKAGDQWAEVMTRSVGKPLYEQAASERVRLAHAQAVKTTVAGPAATAEPTTSSQRLPRRIRITSVEPDRTQENEQFEELRLLRITIKPKPAERELDANAVRVVVTFFDDSPKTKEASPSRAVVPRDALQTEGSWSRTEPRSMTAAYIVPRGFRDEEEQKYGERRSYLGYVVQVYYRDELQDEEVRPRALGAKARDIVPPWRTRNQAPARPAAGSPPAP